MVGFDVEGVQDVLGLLSSGFGVFVWVHAALLGIVLLFGFVGFVRSRLEALALLAFVAVLPPAGPFAAVYLFLLFGFIGLVDMVRTGSIW